MSANEVLFHWTEAASAFLMTFLLYKGNSSLKDFSNSIKELTKSVCSLNEKMAIVVTTLSFQAKELEDHSKRISSLEER